MFATPLCMQECRFLYDRTDKQAKLWYSSRFEYHQESLLFHVIIVP